MQDRWDAWPIPPLEPPLPPVRRIVIVNGKRTSVTLEPVFWALLDDSGSGDTLDYVGACRGAVGLSSALRTYLVTSLVGQL